MPSLESRAHKKPLAGVVFYAEISRVQFHLVALR